MLDLDSRVRVLPLFSSIYLHRYLSDTCEYIPKKKAAKRPFFLECIKVGFLDVIKSIY